MLLRLSLPLPFLLFFFFRNLRLIQASRMHVQCSSVPQRGTEINLFVRA